MGNLSLLYQIVTKLQISVSLLHLSRILFFLFLQIAISDLHKQTIAEHRQSTELTDTTFLSNNSSTDVDEFRRQQHLIRWRKEQWQIDFVQVLCHPAIREIDISREVRH